DYSGGIQMACQDIVKEIKNKGLHRGITFSGGEPFEQAIPCTTIAKEAKKIGLTVWIYTGYTLESILDKDKKDWIEFLKQGDVLVDGPFQSNKKNLRLPFRGSENQRVVDIKKSLKQNEVVLW